MLEVVIIGSGNVAQHLITAFSQSGKVDVVQVVARNHETVQHLMPSYKITSDFRELKEVPLYIIAVSDKAIAEVSSKIPYHDKIVVHTSGAISINELDAKHVRGSFYPVQTFSRVRAVDFKKVPIGIEIEKETMYPYLEDLAHAISDTVFEINSEQRKALHVAAVFVNNFVNHLYQLGSEICVENNIPFEILQPLILETASKVQQLSPKEAQTGPAKRNDSATIDSHLQFLTSENKATIYKILTQSILDNG